MLRNSGAVFSKLNRCYDVERKVTRYQPLYVIANAKTPSEFENSFGVFPQKPKGGISLKNINPYSVSAMLGIIIKDDCAEYRSVIRELGFSFVIASAKTPKGFLNEAIRELERIIYVLFSISSGYSY
jgi:hypothetical protein